MSLLFPISAELACKLGEFDVNRKALLRPVSDVCTGRMRTAPSPLQCHYHEYYGKRSHMMTMVDNKDGRWGAGFNFCNSDTAFLQQ